MLRARRQAKAKKKGGSGMKTVKFLKPYSPYAEGDVAGLSDEEADKLIEEGIAEKYKAGKSVDEPAEDKMVNSPAEKK